MSYDPRSSDAPAPGLKGDKGDKGDKGEQGERGLAGSSGTSGGVANGDKGDIVVSASGTSWLFDSAVVTTFARTFLDDIDAAAVRTTIGAQIAGSYQPLDTQLTDVAALLYTGNAGKVISVNAGATAFELTTPASGGGGVPTTRLINTTAPLAGGGDLSADRTLSIAAATTALPGSMSAADKTKLDGVATGATANSTDASLRDRATHTGTQALSTLANIAGLSFVANASASAAAPAQLSGSSATALLDSFTSALKGLVPPSGGGTANFLRADGTFAAPPGGGGGGLSIGLANALAIGMVSQ